MDNNPRDAAAFSAAAPEEPLLLKGIMPQSTGVRDEEDFNKEPDNPNTTQEPGDPQQKSQEKNKKPSLYQIRVIAPKQPSFAGKVAKAVEGMKKVVGKIRKRFKRKKPTEEPQSGSSKKKHSTRGQPLHDLHPSDEDMIRKRFM